MISPIPFNRELHRVAACERCNIGFLSYNNVDGRMNELCMILAMSGLEDNYDTLMMELERLTRLWSTVYIRGRTGFEQAVIERLQDSKWMKGASERDHNLIMFWLTEPLALREFKMAIGSRIIFKYRLHFYTDLDEYIQSQSVSRHTGFTMAELALIRSAGVGTTVNSSEGSLREGK